MTLKIRRSAALVAFGVFALSACASIWPEAATETDEHQVTPTESRENWSERRMEAEVASTLDQNYTDDAPHDVDCPGGLEIEEGAIIACDVTDANGAGSLDVGIVTIDGDDFEWEAEFTFYEANAYDEEDDVEEKEEAAEEEEVPSTPQAYSALTIIGDEAHLPEGAEGEVSVVAISEPEGNTSFPVIVHNGTDEPVSRVELSGRAIGPDGETLGTGNSHSINPNVVPPDGYAFGYVYIRSSEYSLPPGASIPDIRVGFTEGLGGYENITALDIENFEQLPAGDLTGDVVNPHDVEVGGPISIDTVCLSDDGRVTRNSSFADSDPVSASGTVTWTISSYRDTPGCAVRLISASGYNF